MSNNLLDTKYIKKRIEEITALEIKEINETTEEYNRKIQNIKSKALQERNDFQSKIEAEMKKIKNMFSTEEDNYFTLSSTTTTGTTMGTATKSGNIVR